MNTAAAQLLLMDVPPLASHGNGLCRNLKARPWGVGLSLPYSAITD